MSEIRIVNIEERYCKALAQLQKDCFPSLGEDEWMTEEHYLSHCRIFPQGDFVALEGEKVVGAGAGFFTNFDFEHPNHRFMEMIGNGHHSTHNPDGEWYYGSDISVHPDYRGRGIGGMLYAARQGLVREYKRKGIVAGGTIPGYIHYKGKLNVPQYVEKVVAGEIFDPTLSFQLRNGFEVRGLIENYIEDAASDNWATLIVWENKEV